MLFGIIIVVVAVAVAYLINKSKVSQVSETKIEAPEKIEPIAEQPVKAATKTKAAKKTTAKKSK